MTLVHPAGGEARAREKGIERVARSAPHIVQTRRCRGDRREGVPPRRGTECLATVSRALARLPLGRVELPRAYPGCAKRNRGAGACGRLDERIHISAWCTGPRRSPTFGVQEACRIPHRQARDGRARFGRVVVEQPPAWERPATFVNDLLIAKPKTCLLCNNAWG